MSFRPFFIITSCILLVSVLGFQRTLFGQGMMKALSTEGLYFRSDINWPELLKEAEENKAFIFVSVSIERCPPCETMKKEVFTDPALKAYFSEHFISVEVVFDAKDDYDLFSDLYLIEGPNSFPYFLYFDYFGELVHQTIGGQSISDMLCTAQFVTAVMKEPLPTVEPPLLMGERRFNCTNDSLRRKLAQRKDMERLERFCERDDYMTQYARELAELCRVNQEPYNRWVDKYLSRQGIMLLNGDSDKFIMRFATSLNNLAGETLVENLDHFKDGFGAEANVQVKRLLFNSIRIAASEKDDKLFQRTSSYLKSLQLEQKQAFAFELYSTYYAERLMWKEYIKNAQRYFKIHLNTTPPERINKVAKQVLRYSNKSSDLNTAIQWNQKAVDMLQTYTNHATQAELYYKLGDYEQALLHADFAIRLALEDDQPYKDMSHLIDRITKSSR